MKIVVFGGAGDMGSEAVRDIASAKDLDSLVIADYNLKAAEKLVSSLKCDKASAIFCDANDHDAIVKIMKAADVSLSCIGPFYEYEAKMIRAAIEAKCGYVSICDDFDAAEAALSLDKAAKKAGILVLTGMGWTPGLSNILAKHGMDHMDETREVHISWVGNTDDSEGVAVIKHILHIFTGEVPTYSDGRWKKVPAGSGREKVEFPAPVGKITVYHLGHPEPVTIPHFLSGLKEVTLKGACTPEWVNPIAKALSAVGATNTIQKRNLGAKFFHSFGSSIFKSKGKSFSGIHVRVVGEKNGHQVQYTGACVDNMKRLAGIPASIGTLLLARKHIEGKGVVAPEVIIPTELFLTELKKRGLVVEHKIENL